MVQRLLLLLLLITVIGCGARRDPGRTIVLATTTSTRDSGLLDVLVSLFEQQSGIEVKVVAVGSGQALEMGRRGDADVLLTHAPAAEEAFMAEGYGTERRPVMRNDYVLVGPVSDPAKVRQGRSISAAFKLIVASQSLFVSRGDRSGTHLKELSLWKELDISPGGEWYIRAGSGMAQTLRMASEKDAYTLSDRGTFLAQRDNLELAVLAANDPALQNQYSVIVVDPKRHSHVDVDAARQFAQFLLSPGVQRIIGTFGVDQVGEPLFIPNNVAPDSASG